jgi:PAS domain S-box-containing protein
MKKNLSRSPAKTDENRPAAKGESEFSPRFFQEAFDSLSASIAILDENGTILTVNQGWRQFGCENGLKLENSGIGINYLEICRAAVGEDASTARKIANVIEALLLGDSYDVLKEFEYPCHSPAEKRWFTVRLSQFMENGRKRIIVAHEDITARKLAEEAAIFSEAHFRTLVENSPDLVARFDQQLRHTYVNPAAAQAGVLKPSDYIGKTIRESGVTEPMAGIWEQRIQLALDAGEMVDVVDTFITPGGPRYFHTRLVPEHASGGSVVSVMSIARDITERKLAEEALAESENRFATIFKSSPVAIAITRMDNKKLVDVNTTWEILTGFSRSEVLGHSPMELNLWVETPQREKLVKQAEQGGLSRSDVRVRRKSGEICDLLMSAEVLNMRGEAFLLTMAQDITARKQLELQALHLNRLYSTLSQINQAIVRAHDQDELFKKICQIAISFGNYRLAWIGLVDEASYELKPAAYAGKDEGFLKNMKFSYLDERSATGPSCSAFNQNRCMISQDIEDDSSIDPSWREAALQRRFRSAAAVPIRKGGKVVGTFTVYDEEAHTFDIDFEKLLDEIGDDISFALDTFEMQEKQKKALEALQVSEDKFKYVFDHSVVGKSITLPDGYVSVNQSFAEMLGYSIEEMTKFRWQELTYPEDIEATQRFLDPLLRGECEKTRFIKRYLHKNGSIIWADVSTALRRDEHGKLLYYLTSILDISELKLVEDCLREMNRTLEQRVAERTAQVQDLYDYAPAGYHSLDAEENFIEINQTELNWLGCSREEIIGKYAAAIFTPKSEETFRKNFQRLKEKGVLSDLELEILRKDGTIFPVLLNAIAVYDEHGHYLTSRSTVIDITERKHAEEVLRIANAELEQAMRIKDEFLANMSHELRTPLTGILGVSEILLDEIAGPLNEKQKQYLRIVDSSSRHLLSLINDILDLSKIEAGKLVPEFEVVNVDEICRASLSFVKEMSLKKHITVGYSCEPIDLHMTADLRRLKQILVNLLSNAVKFTPNDGRVVLTVRGDRQNGVVLFSVEDTGVGIDTKDINRIFEPFVQVDGSLSRQFEGTGLGLPLVKKLTEMHGGAVQAESEMGRGSRFMVSIPWRQIIELHTNSEALAAPDKLCSEANRLGGQILLAEDNNTNALLTQDYLECSGYKVSRAHHGGEVLPMMESVHPDLILMDIQMPVINGLEVIRTLRGHQEFKDIPIIALTGLAMKGDRERCLGAGANEYVTKPFPLKVLVKMIEQLLKDKEK